MKCQEGKLFGRRQLEQGEGQNDQGECQESPSSTSRGRGDDSVFKKSSQTERKEGKGETVKMFGGHEAVVAEVAQAIARAEVWLESRYAFPERLSRGRRERSPSLKLQQRTKRQLKKTVSRAKILPPPPPRTRKIKLLEVSRS